MQTQKWVSVGHHMKNLRTQISWDWRQQTQKRCLQKAWTPPSHGVMQNLASGQVSIVDNTLDDLVKCSTSLEFVTHQENEGLSQDKF